MPEREMPHEVPIPLTEEEIAQVKTSYEAAQPSWKHELTIPVGAINLTLGDDGTRSYTEGPIWTYMLEKVDSDGKRVDTAIFIQDGYHRMFGQIRGSKNISREMITVIKLARPTDFEEDVRNKLPSQYPASEWRTMY